MVVSSNSNENRAAMWQFLRLRGVEIPRSEDFQAIGRISPSTGKLVGVVGFNGFCGQVCWIHMAGDGNWISRELLRAAFHYPFVQVPVVQLFGAVAGDNFKALKLNKHLGFQVLYRVRNGWAGGIDLVVHSMSAAECKWLRMPQPRRKDVAQAA